MAEERYLDLGGLSTLWGQIVGFVDESIKLSKEIVVKTTAEWADASDTISKQGVLYVYSDYATDDLGRTVANVKVGDGQAYVVDLPFINSLEQDHMNNALIHVSNEDRARWDEKVRCYYTDENDLNELVFTTN